MTSFFCQRLLSSLLIQMLIQMMYPFYFSLTTDIRLPIIQGNGGKSLDNCRSSIIMGLDNAPFHPISKNGVFSTKVTKF